MPEPVWSSQTGPALQTELRLPQSQLLKHEAGFRRVRRNTTCSALPIVGVPAALHLHCQESLSFQPPDRLDTNLYRSSKNEIRHQPDKAGPKLPYYDP